jgi:phage gpG-like protein
MSYEITLIGADGVIHALEGLTVKTKEAGTRLLTRVANEVVNDVKPQLYPGHGLVTGNLQRSITFEIRDDGMTAAIGTNVVYGPYIEFGAPMNNAGGRVNRFLGYHMFQNTMAKVPGWIETELRTAGEEIADAWDTPTF